MVLGELVLSRGRLSRKLSKDGVASSKGKLGLRLFELAEAGDEAITIIRCVRKTSLSKRKID